MAARGEVRVWDAFVRVFHWSLVASFLAAYFFTEDGDRPHEIVGYIALGLIAVRLVWGFIGSVHARFADFVPSPVTLFAYLRAMLRRREQRYLGHNPAGGAMIIALLVTIAIASISGWLLITDAFWGVAWMETLHDWSADVCLALACLHIGGVVYSSWRHRENLVKAMFTGRKRADL